MHVLCTCKGLDCKDDLKLFKYDDLKFKLYFLTLMWSLNEIYNDIGLKSFY